MISEFYRAGSRRLLAVMAISFPLLYVWSDAAVSNNDIETWLPRDTAVRRTYENFKRDFGVEETVLVGFAPQAADETLVEALAVRLERLPGVRQTLTPQRLAARMEALGVPTDEAQRRLAGLLTDEQGRLSAVVVSLDAHGAANRAATVARIRSVLDYCRLERPDLCLTGSPVLVTELDRLGSPEASRGFFLITLLVCLGLLQYSLGDWRMSLSLLGTTLWSICLTKATVLACGGEMNFIMGALSVMVMVFTLSIAVHYLSYYASAREAGDPDPLRTALLESWKPCFLSTLTTLLGLVSLNVSAIAPVRQFGYAAGLGSVVAMVVGLGVTPCLVVLWPDCMARGERRWFDFAAWGGWVGRHARPLLGASLAVILLAGWGILRLRPDIDPVEFLPRGNAVASDLRRLERDLTSIGSIEAVVDFGADQRSFAEKLDDVRRIQDRIAGHASVRHVLSVASFFPDELPDGALDVAMLLQKALEGRSAGDYLADGQRLWRISVRFDEGAEANVVARELREELAGAPVTWTGVSPLIADAQEEIFKGYWQSFTQALLTIGLVMILALRSPVRGLIAMVPNILPVWLVFGAVGFVGLPIDIGMMMTGSIALGISVDCTFHFLVRYQQRIAEGRTAVEASSDALEHSGRPLIESTVITSLGMLALCLSRFTPTSRFGWLMAAQMTASLLGELLLLPALLCAWKWSGGRKKSAAKSTAAAPTVAEPAIATTPAIADVVPGRMLPGASTTRRETAHAGPRRPALLGEVGSRVES